MSTSTSERPPFAPDELAAVLGRERARVEPLGHGPTAATAGLWRVAAGGRSAVLKVLRHDPQGHPRWPAETEPEHPYYWRREACAYESGLLERLAGGLRAPRLLGLFDRPDDTVALWLEDVPEPGLAWPLERYGVAALHLGRAQGALAQDPPEEPWLSRRWLRAYLGLRSEYIEGFLAPGPERSLWEGRERTLRVLERGPLTLSHLDLHPGNLFGGGEDETVLADWAYCGLAAVGEDAGNLVLDSLLDGILPPERGEELARVVWTGFARGLREGGWDGDLGAVRLAFVAATALKYAWLEERIPKVDEESATRWRRLLPLRDAMAEEACRHGVG